jgi:hypothetical protein
MKSFSVTGLILLVIFLASRTHAQFFNGPESVTYDALNSRYLISNVLNGDIVQISDAGDTTYFDTSLTRTLGYDHREQHFVRGGYQRHRNIRPDDRSERRHHNHSGDV